MAASTIKQSKFFENSFVPTLLKQLDEQRKYTTFCDVVLKVCDTSIHVHSNILAAASPYFHEILGQGEDNPRAFSQNTPQVIEIHIDENGDKDSYGKAVGLIVDYFYSGQITVTSDIINHVFEISKMMCLFKLASFCEWFQKERIDDGGLSEVDEKKIDQDTCGTEAITCYKIRLPGNNDDEFGPVVPRPIVKEEHESNHHKRKRGRPKKISRTSQTEKEVSSKKKKYDTDEHANDDTDEEAEENELYVSESTTRSGRIRKLTSKMKELKSLSKDNAMSDLGDDRKKDIKYSCVFCSYTSNVLLDYQHHIKSHKQEKRTKKYKCDMCKFSCKKAKKLLVHKKEHLYEKYHCDLCDYNGETKEDFENHMKMHEDPLPFFCKYCDQRFRTKTQLNFHHPKHSKDKPFVCKICGAGFKWKHALKNHMVTHSTTKEHLCDVCGFATAHKSQLKAHKLLHTGETFKCTECNFEATRRQNLKYHLLTHTREKPHQCDICGQSFSLIKNMKRHMLLHTNNRPYKCDQCTFSTTRYDKLKEHLKKHHGQGNETKKKADNLSRSVEFIMKSPQTSKIVTTSMVPTESGTSEGVEVDVLSTIQTLQIQVEGNKVVGVQNHEGEGLLVPTAEGSLQPITLTKLQDDGSEIVYHFVQLT